MKKMRSNIYEDPARHGASDPTPPLCLTEPNKTLPDLFCSPLPD